MTQYGTDLLLNILVEDSPNGLYLVGRDSKLKYVNNRIAEWLGATSRDDLQTPIRHIYSFGELLEKRAGGSMDEKSKLFLQNILESSQAMSALIEGLLSFSRIGRSEIKKTRIELVHLVEAVRDDLMLECAGRDIEWKIGENCELYADIQLIRLAAINLIGNALKYTSGNDKTIIEIGSEMRGDFVTVFIKDNGVGFNMKYADRLFGVFQRLHSQDDFEGTGIGLANVKRIITRHGGRVRAEGVEGKGATFYFSLPVDKE